MAKFKISPDLYKKLTAKRSSKNKFGAIRTEIDSILFHSKKEGDFYLHLKDLQKMGRIKCIMRQVPFHLPGRKKYVIDFLTIDHDNRVEFFEVKGVMTPLARLKIDQTEEIYKVKINIV